MVSAIDFAVRDSAGGTQRGSVAGEGQGNFIQVGSGDSVSLNLSRSSIVSYEQQGGDLVIALTDGRKIILSGYFDEAAGDENRLYLSDNGTITEVVVTGTGDGLLYADYGPLQGWEKWSPLDDLRFADADGVSGAVAASEDPAGMAGLVPGLMGGAGGLGAAAALVGGATVIGGGGGGGTSGGGGDGGDGDGGGGDGGDGDGGDGDGGDGDGGDGDGGDGDGGDGDGGDGDGGDGGHALPTVDDQDADPLTTNTDNPHITVTGTGEPGDGVVVTIGGLSETAVIGEDGTWSVTFPADGLPGDGTHVAEVVVTQPDGVVHELTGPGFVIDMTPPAVETTFGTTAQNDIENLAEYADGVSLGGTGEIGATIAVVINGHTQTTTVGADGQWTVTFPQSELPGGDYHELAAQITATDPLGNQTVLNQTVAIDTVPHPISVTSAGGDNVVNLTEMTGGYQVTGTSTPGATLTVTIGEESHSVTVGADGLWVAGFGASSIFADGAATVTVATVDGAGNASSTSFDFVVDTLATLAVNPVAGNDLVNAAENGGILTVTGTAEVGSTNVMVSWNGTTLAATVDPATGNWTADFPAGLFASMQATDSQITVTALDAAGNAASASRTVVVDTLAEVAIDDGQIGGDDRMSLSESAGFSLTGTADAGASVQVTFEGQTVTVTADADGNWTAPFALAEFGAVTRSGEVTVVATDAAGNSASATHTIQIDTEVQNFSLTAVDDLSSLAIGADAVNADEALDGVTISGTVEPGSTVTVEWGDMTLPASAVTVNALGIWTATVPASAIPPGEDSVTVTATARDQHGNLSSTLTQEVGIDRVVEPLTRSGGQIGGDGYVNALEATAGVVLTGTVEPNSTVFVSVNGGTPVQTTATADGTWTLTVPASSLPQGNDVPVSVQVSAQDWVGNLRELASETIILDTIAPTEAEITKDTSEGNVISAIWTGGANNDFDYFAVDASGGAVEQAVSLSNVIRAGAVHTQAVFSEDIPDGTYLVVRNEDAAGNEASTLYLRNSTGPVEVDLAREGLQEFDFGTINLSAADATLSISEAQVMALTGADKQLTIVGGTDDVVNLAGVTAVADTGDGFRLYSLGSAGASVLIEDDVTVNTTGV